MSAGLFCRWTISLDDDNDDDDDDDSFALSITVTSFIARVLENAAVISYRSIV